MINSNSSFYLKFDKLTPIKQFEYLRNKKVIEDPLINFSKQKIQLSDLILISLHSIDRAFKDKLKYSNHYFYLFSDNSLKYLIKKTMGQSFKNTQFKYLMFYLGITSLIYRFTCAKKFCIKNTNTKQLRINSWGEAYIEKHRLLKKYKQIENNIYKECCICINSEIKKYQKLSKLLSKKIHPKIARKINSHNIKVKIKLVS